MADQIKATVFIPTYNGEVYLDEILRMLFKQKTEFEYEVLIMDSGSTDRTLSIIAKYQKLHDNLRLETIPNTEFGHGRTRNLGAKLARGEFIVYLSHDAVPAHTRWLTEMLQPFDINEKVVAVFGKQDPRRHCFPLMKYDIQGVFSKLGPDHAGIALYYDGEFIKDKATRDFVAFYSDVNSATRREFLLNVIPYRDVKYAEDQLFGEDIIRAGYIKAYTPRGNVWHSNDMKLGEYRYRMFDETMGLRRGGHKIASPSVKAIIKAIVLDNIRILRDGQYGRKRKLYWLVVNPLFHVERWRGIRKAARTHLDNQEEVDNHSLEARRKR